jgi:hypothetical protein
MARPPDVEEITAIADRLDELSRQMFSYASREATKLIHAGFGDHAGALLTKATGFIKVATKASTEIRKSVDISPPDQD